MFKNKQFCGFIKSLPFLKCQNPVSLFIQRLRIPIATTLPLFFAVRCLKNRSASRPASILLFMTQNTCIKFLFLDSLLHGHEAFVTPSVENNHTGRALGVYYVQNVSGLICLRAESLSMSLQVWVGDR